MSINELKENAEAVVKNLHGDQRFNGRITSIGLTPGCKLSVIKEPAVPVYAAADAKEVPLSAKAAYLKMPTIIWEHFGR